MSYISICMFNLIHVAQLDALEKDLMHDSIFRVEIFFLTEKNSEEIIRLNYVHFSLRKLSKKILKK